MLILKNVTAVQLHPAKVQEGVDIAIENDVIVAIGDALTQRYPDASFKEISGGGSIAPMMKSRSITAD